MGAYFFLNVKTIPCVIQAEGIPQDYTIPMLIELNETQTNLARDLSITFPPNKVDGSEYIQAFGIGR